MRPLPSLILFARAPEHGRIKTRLVPLLGESGVLRLYEAFLEDAARAYGAGGVWSPVLAAEPDPSHPALARIFPPPWRRERQAPGDLGRRLTVAFDRAFRSGAPAAIAVGSDHPALPRVRLEELLAALEEPESAAIIPADDGGYCAIALRRGTNLGAFFDEIPWSSVSVLETTLARARAAAIPVALLASGYDVDRPEDLSRLRADLAGRDPASGDYPRSTAAALAELRGTEAS